MGFNSASKILIHIWKNASVLVNELQVSSLYTDVVNSISPQECNCDKNIHQNLE